MSKTEAMDLGAGAQVGAQAQPLEATKGRLKDITKDMTEEEIDAIIGDRKLTRRMSKKIYKKTGLREFRVFKWRVHRRLMRADAGKGLTVCKDLEDMYKRIGI